MFLSCQNIGIDTLKKWNIKLEHHFLLAIVWSFQNKEKTCFISLDTIAEYMNEYPRKIDRLIKDLKNKGFIFCNGKEKALTQKGTRYCKEVFCYPTPKTQGKNSHAIVPSWYSKYQEEIEQKEQEKLKIPSNEVTQEMIDATNAFPD